MFKLPKTLTTVLAATGFLFGASLSAQVVLINLGGIDASPDLATSDGVLNNWNSITTPNTGLATVIDSTGATVAGVSIATSNFSTNNTFDNNTSTSVYGSGGSIAPWLDTDAVELPWYSAGTNGQVVISGLTASAYTVDFIAARSSAGGDPSERIADYTVNGNFADSTPNGDDFSSYLDGWVNGSVLTWNSVAPDGGQITLLGTGAPNAHFDAIRVTAVPEPSTIALVLGLVSLAWIWRRRLS